MTAAWVLKINISFLGFPTVSAPKLKPLLCGEGFSSLKTWQIFAQRGCEGGTHVVSVLSEAPAFFLRQTSSSKWYQVLVHGSALYL